MKISGNNNAYGAAVIANTPSFFWITCYVYLAFWVTMAFYAVFGHFHNRHITKGWFTTVVGKFIVFLDTFVLAKKLECLGFKFIGSIVDVTWFHFGKAYRVVRPFTKQHRHALTSKGAVKALVVKRTFAIVIDSILIERNEIPGCHHFLVEHARSFQHFAFHTVQLLVEGKD